MNNGIQCLSANLPVDTIVQRVKAVLAEKNIKLFAVVDHSGEAAQVGLLMPNTKLLIFGSPRAGTAVMLSAASAALDLPLKILISQEPDGSAMLFWNDPAWLQQRHNFPPELITNLSGVEAIARAATA